MNSIISVRLEGMVKPELLRSYRELLLKDIKEGLIVIDDSVKEITVTSISNLGIDEE